VNEQIRDYRPEDAAAVEDLWERCFGRAAGGQTVAWIFRPGPAGDAPRSVVEVDGRVVAHAGVAPMRFRLGGDEVRGGYSVGAMTDPDFQGRGLFARVGKHLYERLDREGFAFVAGFSNQQSHRLMTTRLGRTPIRPFPWCVRILAPMAAARSLLLGSPPAPLDDPAIRAERIGAIRLEPCAPDDERLDALWERARESVRIGGVRDAAYARWRFASRPEAGYAALLALRGDTPLAWAVHRDLTLRGLRARFLVDWLVAPDAEDAPRMLLRALERAGRRAGAVLMSALRPGTGPAARALGRAGYWRVPEALHPQVIRFSVRGFGRWAEDPRLSDAASWYLGWADTDVV
jgi:predicted N-acetyltransferase YhbS